MKTEKYIKAMKAALLIQQKKFEIKQLLRELSDNLTMTEVIARQFDNESATNAWAVVRQGLELRHGGGIKCAVETGGIVIYLHEGADGRGDKIMHSLLAEIQSQEVIKSVS